MWWVCTAVDAEMLSHAWVYRVIWKFLAYTQILFAGIKQGAWFWCTLPPTDWAGTNFVLWPRSWISCRCSWLHIVRSVVDADRWRSRIQASFFDACKIVLVGYVEMLPPFVVSTWVRAAWCDLEDAVMFYLRTYCRSGTRIRIWRSFWAWQVAHLCVTLAACV